MPSYAKRACVSGNISRAARYIHDPTWALNAGGPWRFAEFERHLILPRTNEGRVRAKARGVRFGRKPKLTSHQQAEALARIAQGETLTAIAKSYNVSHLTISRLGV